MLPENTTTIDELIQSGDNVTISYFNTSFIDQMSNGTWVSTLNEVSDYIDELKNASILIKLTPEQQQKYFYKPKLLCYDVYNNTELYFVILLINDMADVKEFTKPVLRMLRRDHMIQLMSNIYNAEYTSMQVYNENS